MKLNARLAIRLFAVLLVAQGSSGCIGLLLSGATMTASMATHGGKRARNEYIRTQVEAYVYDRPIDEVWRELAMVVSREDGGYKITRTGEYSLDTNTRIVNRQSIRFLAWATPIDRGHCTVHVETVVNGNSVRDWTVEWKLMKRLEPDDEKRIVAQAGEARTRH